MATSIAFGSANDSSRPEEGDDGGDELTARRSSVALSSESCGRRRMGRRVVVFAHELEVWPRSEEDALSGFSGESFAKG